MNASVANQRTRMKMDRKVFEGIKESNGEYLVNLYESNYFESHNPGSLVTSMQLTVS